MVFFIFIQKLIILKTFGKQIVDTLIRLSVVSDVGPHCLPMSLKNDLRLIWDKREWICG